MSNVKDLFPGYVSAMEAAQSIGRSHSQITRYIKNGLIKSKKIGRQHIIREADIEGFVPPPAGNPTFRKPKKRKGKK